MWHGGISEAVVSIVCDSKGDKQQSGSFDGEPNILMVFNITFWFFFCLLACVLMRFTVTKNLQGLKKKKTLLWIA